jgi:FtsP/CotA-like multicopper oxidase with cupredoxin domain
VTKFQHSSFKVSPVAAAIAIAVATSFGANVAQAGSGFGSGLNVSNTPVAVPSYYANSPAGPSPALTDGATTPAPGTGLPVTINSGKALRKFVDTLPLLNIPGVTSTKQITLNGTPVTVPATANNLGQYIPVAVSEKWVDLNGKPTLDDYYEIAAVEYTEQMHSDLGHATKLRGYVQLMTPGLRAMNVPVKTFALPGGRVLDVVDTPHHLGPIIQSAAGTAVRVKFVNYLPVGGKLFLPVDTTLTGAGFGQDGVTPYSENRASMHLVGGQSPWISAGTPHQWIAPAGETNPGVVATKTITASVTSKLAKNKADTVLTWPVVLGATDYTVTVNGTLYTVNPPQTGPVTLTLKGIVNPTVNSAVANNAAGPQTDARGVSNSNVPDMADPGPGATTLYFPNDMSARFTFVQDRTSGLTRLNAYAGLQAGYMVTDDVEKAMINGGSVTKNGKSPAYVAGTIPADQIPLIIEDKTFVPSDIAQQDSLWNTSTWGAAGDLWFPHVYETNQAPLGTSVNGTNPVGRWDFGPLFWPIFPANDVLPAGAVSSVPEAFMDTPLINGTAYPKLTVDPKAYRFRILNASNDRYINLALYKADPAAVAPQLDLNGNPIVDASGNPVVMTNTEVKMVPAVGDAAGNPVGWDAVNGVQLPLPQYPALATNIVAEPSGPARAWPVDSRIGGAPAPLDALGKSLAGPDFIVIGNDGGFLPHPVDIPAQPVTYESNRRSITVGNIYGYGLLLGPSERADAIVDFSQYAGQTLILYNDAPAPAPFNDVRNDYFTGGPDQTGAGGAYATKPGYGPNTRTMMQIVVNGTANGTAYDPTALAAALPVAYGQTQPLPVVPETAYNAAFGTTGTDNYAHVPTGSLEQPTLDFTLNGVLTLSGLAVGTGGSGYSQATPPAVSFNNANCLPTGGASASARAVVKGGAVTSFIFSPGSGYTCEPTVTIAAPRGRGNATATATVTSNLQKIAVLTKAEQELFDNFGRYNSTGGVELPKTNNVIQTTVPLNYIDSATEILTDSEVQIWKLVDNGLWTNSMHFNMVDVQLLNRVGWDGTVKPPANNELGWRDTLRLNPLEDVIVAIRAKRPSVPFGMPQSSRLQDPSKVEGVGTAPAGQKAGPGFASGLGFTNGLGVTPQPSLTNVVANYDNEFAWGSAILGHAENDLTRPIIYQPKVLPPAKVTGLALSGTNLVWTDATPAATSLANTQNEIGFKLMQATLDSWGVLSAFTQVDKVPANKTSWAVPAASAGFAFQVVAYNAAGDSAPSAAFAAQPKAPTITAGALAFNSVTLNWSGGSTANSLVLYRNGTKIATLQGTVTTYTDTPVNASTTYTYQIRAVNDVYPTATGQAISSLAVTTPAAPPPPPPAAPSGVTAAKASANSITVKWADNSTNETGFTIQRSANNGATWTTVGTVGVNVKTFTNTGLGKGTYLFQVRANGAASNSLYVVCAASVAL